MNQTYYVYKHTSPSNKVYIGITCNPKRRWANGSGYLTKANEHYVQRSFARAILKYGWNNFSHEILYSNLDLAEAQRIEIELIAKYKSLGLSYNMTDGGEGTNGIHPILSEKRKEQIRKQVREHPPMLGKHHTEETKKKISIAAKGRKISEEERKKRSERRKGISLSEEAKQKLRIYKKSHPETWIGGWNKIPIYQYDFHGDFIAEYESAQKAAESCCKTSSSKIIRCCKGIISSAFGYIWRYDKTDKIDTSNYKIVKTSHGYRLYDISEVGKRKRRDGHGKKVNQYSLEGVFIATFSSITDAAEQTGTNIRGIQGCVRHLPRYYTAGGYKWEYANE